MAATTSPWVWDKDKREYCYHDSRQNCLVYQSGPRDFSPSGAGWIYDQSRNDYCYYSAKESRWIYLGGLKVKSDVSSAVAVQLVSAKGASSTSYEIEDGDEEDESYDEEDESYDEEDDDEDGDDKDEAVVTAVASGLNQMSLGPSRGTYGYPTTQGYPPTTSYSTGTGYQSTQDYPPYGYQTAQNYQSSYSSQDQMYNQQSYYDLIPALVQGQREISLDESIRLFTKIVQIKYHGKYISGVARLDTAADYNIINYSWARKQGIHRHGKSIDDSPGMILADGSIARARKRGFYQWGLKEGEHEWRSYFFLMEGLPSDVVIGVHELCKVGFMNLLQPSMMDRIGGLCPIFSSKSKSK
jgi:hypothetical protein